MLPPKKWHVFMFAVLSSGSDEFTSWRDNHILIAFVTRSTFKKKKEKEKRRRNNFQRKVVFKRKRNFHTFSAKMESLVKCESVRNSN